MATHAVNVVVKARDDASKKFNKIGKSAGGMSRVLKSAAGAMVAFLGIRQLVRGTKEILAAHAEQMASERKLETALKATGHAAGFTAEQLKEYAAGLQQTTIFGDEAIITGMSLMATFKNIKGDYFKAATILAQDMSYAMGTDLKSSIIQVGKAMNDPIKGVGALSRVGVQFTEQQKEQIKTLVESGQVAKAQKIILRELAGQFGGQSTDAVSTFSGQVKQLGNSWGDAKESMGQYLAKSALFQTVIKSTKIIIENFSTFWGLVIATNKLRIVSFWESLKHLFAVQIPELLHWFGRNWKEIFVSIWRVAKAFFVNIAKNIANFFKALWSAIKGEGFNFEWTGLLEGFESTLKEMPKIVKREMSATEKQLEKEIERLENILADAAKPKKGPDLAALIEGEGGTKTAASKIGGGGNQSLAARESRFLTFSPGSYRDPAVETKKNTANIAKNTQATNEKLSELIEIIMPKTGNTIQSTSFA